MSRYTKVFVILGYFFSSIIVLNKCKKIAGYKFPVYSTPFCPRNESEWNNRSLALNCNNTNGYTCLPNEKLTELVEFCYTVPWIWIEEGFCLYLKTKVSYVDAYNCSHFIDGCHNTSYQSRRIFDYPACISLGYGCFLAEQSCKSSPNVNRPDATENDKDDLLLVVFVIGIIVFIISCISFFILYFYRKRKKCFSGKRSTSNEGTLTESEERKSLISDTENEKGFSNKNNESKIEKDLFDQWKHEDLCFISTKASKEVEKIIKIKNLVIVTGHSGSGKSAIIQHIALKYREQGWRVKRVKKVEDIMDEYSSSRFEKDKTICIFNDPFGKESFDEILNNSWQTYEEELKLYLQTAKLMMSCRNHIISDARLTRYLVNQSHIVDIDDNKNKLSVDEKRKILPKYTFGMNLSDTECEKIVEVERYFPLLCKLYSSKEDTQNNSIGFFTAPVAVLQEEILGFRTKDKNKYCALVLLVLYNNDLCVGDLLKTKDTKNKFKHTLNLCGVPENTPPSAIGDTLNTLKGFFVKQIGDTYRFYHDLVMEVTTHLFGTDYPAEIIKYADIGFLRRRVRLGNCDKHNDPFTIYLKDKYIEELEERLISELFGERLLDVVLNPCLKHANVIKMLKGKIADHPGNIKQILETKKITVNKQELYETSNHLLLTKASFLELENEVSPLFALIVFCHTQLSHTCLDILKQMQTNITSCFPAVCCNGSTELFCSVFKDQVIESLSKTWGGLFPIHIVSMFHNYKLLNEMIKIGADVNLKLNDNGLTPLTLAAGNDTEEYEDFYHGESGATRRDKTVQILLSNGADINCCKENGSSPLHKACHNGHDSTVKLLLDNGAEINLCTKDGYSPLFLACQQGHASTAQLLLNNGADVSLCTEEGASPLFVACQKGHDKTIKLLVNEGANINLCMKTGASPLLVACQNGYDSIVLLLLNNAADVNLIEKDGLSPLYLACQNGHDSIVQLLLNNDADINLCGKEGLSPFFVACKNEHNSTLQLLLKNGADINLCAKIGASPLFIACQNGCDKTVPLLLTNGADVNLCMKDGVSPLYIACQNGHDSIVQLLLNNGADTNLCIDDGASPLYAACQNGHDSTVQILLKNGADTNLCNKAKASPLFTACCYGHDTCSTVQLLLNNGADVNLCLEDGTSPLYVACQNGHDSNVQLLLNNGANIKDGVGPLFVACQKRHDSTVKLLLNNGADVNLCMEDGASPLYVACQMGHDTTVQLLLKNGANINLCKEVGVSPLFIACQNGHNSTVKLLLKNGADVNLCTKDGASPLFIACQNGNDGTVKLLLKDKAKIDLCMEKGGSPLYIACQMGHNSTAQILLKNGAEINLCNKAKASPLLIACRYAHDSTVQLLLNNGADVNLCMEDGASPLYVACQMGHESTVQILLNSGANINLCNHARASPLLTACHYGHESIVQRLLNNGADVNLCMENGARPLYVACRMGHHSIAQLLRDNGAV